MDALVASDLTGQTAESTPKTRPPSSIALEKVSIPPQALTGPVSKTPVSLEGSRKRHRQRAPSQSPLEEVEDITGTPRTVRIAKLFPGDSVRTAKPLGTLIQRLLDVSKATLIPKSKRTKTVSVDIESAADIVLLVGLIQEQASINEARRVVFDPQRQTIPNPSPSSIAPNAQFEFKSDAWSEKIDALADQVAKLVSVITPDQQQQPPQTSSSNQSSYALAASKHAPKGAHPPKQQQPRPRTQQKQTNRPKTEASLTLNQMDPKVIAGEGKTIPELIKILNTILKEDNIKVSKDDAHPIVVRNIHRHPSNDLVIYLES
ncbi:hypothetical protein DFH28DRAFT_899931, partial [Melampsora americana]